LHADGLKSYYIMYYKIAPRGRFLIGFEGVGFEDPWNPLLMFVLGYIVCKQKLLILTQKSPYLARMYTEINCHF